MKNYTQIKNEHKLELTNHHGVSLKFLANGNLAAISYKNLMLNLYESTFVEASLSNIYLRIFSATGIEHFALIGAASSSKFGQSQDSALWSGTVAGIEYLLRCHLDANSTQWFWSVELTNHGTTALTYDLVYVQDLGLADVGAVRSNEAYTSQYIDHLALQHPTYGYCVASRQNVAQTIAGVDSFPWILQGSLNSTQAYLTDGFQFYGLNYKETNLPSALACEKLPSTCLQYEFALTGLQTAQTQLAAGQTAQATFFAYFMANHPSSSSAADLALVAEVATKFQATNAIGKIDYFAPVSTFVCSSTVLNSLDLSTQDVQQLFGNDLRHVESEADNLLSFFYSSAATNALTTSRHVVLKAKELQMDRPHGQIIFSGCDNDFAIHRLSSTAYMNGIFNSQITFGNTSFNKLLSVARNHLNVFKLAGQRIFIRHADGSLEQLGLPSAFELGVNFARWIYKSATGTIEVKTWSTANQHQINLSISSSQAQQFVISNNLVAGVNEDDSFPVISYGENNTVIIQPAVSELICTKNPAAKFTFTPFDANSVAKISRGEVFTSLECAAELAYLVYETKVVSEFGLCISAQLSATELTPVVTADFAAQVSEFETQWFKKINQFSLSHAHDAAVGQFNDLMVWYMHNAMVHYLVPHGLEQYSGAAWGTRDVCQGPMELFLSTGDYAAARKVLLTIFSHQYLETGGWPQWFMFDEFYSIQQHESHGDVIVWPLKAALDYIEASNDLAVLQVELPFTQFASGEFTPQAYSLREHLIRELKNIKDNFIPNTTLSCYGDGDWDDTLQPANPEQRKSMVSGWTVQLTYQVFVKAAKILTQANDLELAQEMAELAAKIHRDYNHYVIQDEVVAGFILFDQAGVAEPLLHPRDTRTGIKYRLLPMTRGIISELFSPEQALQHYKLIKENLFYSDGVRLMNQPATYAGGVNTIFKRAELAANVGREVGLQYVHAHIRFIEAMAKLGHAEDVWHGLQQINPILIDEVVENAAKRQSNSYFSSSDADFDTRYDAQQNWDKLKDASVQVRGGWRIYSSGPGIYINQLIRNFLGIRLRETQVELDPVICRKLDGLEFAYDYAGYGLNFVYHVQQGEFAPQKIVINGSELSEFTRLDNPYRLGGIVIAKDVFVQALKAGISNQIDIYL